MRVLENFKNNDTLLNTDLITFINNSAFNEETTRENLSTTTDTTIYTPQYSAVS